jgi:glycosyltransferase 2 family protein
MTKGLKKAVQYILAAIIIVVCIYFVVQDIDFGKLWTIIRNADYQWVLYSIPIMLFSHVIRAIRWKTLLKPFMEAKSIWNLFSAVMVGYAFNNFLPRGGEIVRPFVYARRERVSKTSVFATIVIERFLDVLTLLTLFGVAFFLRRTLISGAFPWLTADRMTFFIAVTFVCVILIIILTIYPSFSKWLLSIVLKPFSKKWYNEITRIWNNFLQGFGIIKNPSQWLRLGFDSYLMWFFYILPMFLTFFSFDFLSRLNLGFGDAALILILVGIAFSIAPAPGAIGIYHSVVVVAMTNFYGISKEEALAYATLNHGMNYLLQIIVGGMFILRENIKKLPQESDLDKDEIPETIESDKK